MKIHLRKGTLIAFIILVLGLFAALPVHAQDKTAEIMIHSNGTNRFELVMKNSQPVKGVRLKIAISEKEIAFDALEESGKNAEISRLLKSEQQQAELIVTAKDGLPLKTDGTMHLGNVSVKGKTGITYNVIITELEYVEGLDYQRTLLKENEISVSGDTTLTTGGEAEKKDQEELKLLKPEAQTYRAEGNIFELKTEGGSGNGAITYTVDADTDKVEIEGSNLTVKAAGTYTLTAEKAGDDTYNAIQSNSVEVTVHQAETPVEWVRLLEDQGILQIKSAIKPESVRWNGTELTAITAVEGEIDLYSVALPAIKKENSAEIWVSDNYKIAVFSTIYGSGMIEPDKNDTPQGDTEEGQMNQSETQSPSTGLVGAVDDFSMFSLLTVLALMSLSVAILMRRAK